jgi:SAM-dependent methyltransferase
VIANHCIYHFPDRQKAFSEIQRVLKPGGVFYATTVGDDHLKELLELVSNFEVEIEDAFDPSGNPFTLESGGDQLRTWFSDIQTDRYLDSLVVTETAPLVDFLLSTARFSLDEIKRDDLSAHIESLMQSNGGAIYIHKDSGIFISSKA